MHILETAGILGMYALKTNELCELGWEGQAVGSPGSRLASQRTTKFNGQKLLSRKLRHGHVNNLLVKKPMFHIKVVVSKSKTLVL